MKDLGKNHFEEMRTATWKLALQAGLKGADYHEKLVWESLEGIHVKPFYHSDEDAIATPDFSNREEWKIAETFYTGNVKSCKKLIVAALLNGTDSLILEADKPFDAAYLLSELPKKPYRVYLQTRFSDAAFFEKFILLCKEFDIKIHLLFDPVGHLVQTGNWFKNLTEDREVLENLSAKFPDISVAGIHASVYQEAGANMVQQLAYTLAQLAEYSRWNSQLPFTILQTVGSNYFFEIAKIKALRWLHASLADKLQSHQPLHILAMPGKRNKTLYDYNVNLLRSTTECMSAVLGGADEVANLPYDAFFKKDHAFSRRLARNQLLILKEESFLNRVQNPAQGSYYIENLTQALAEKALLLFKQTEKEGGLLAQLKKGTVQEKVIRSHQKEQKMLQEGKLVLVGTTRYQDKTEQARNRSELYPFVKLRPEKTLIKPLTARRLAENIEKERLENES